MSQVDPYRTTGAMGETELREVRNYLYPSGFTWGARIFSVLIAVVALLPLIAKDWGSAALYSALAVFFVLFPNLVQRRYIKLQLSRMRENSPDGMIRYESFFTVDGAVLRNLTNHGETLLRYEAIAAAASTPNLFLIMSRSRQFLLVFKNCLTPEQQESFLPFLKERCPKLKVRR